MSNNNFINNYTRANKYANSGFIFIESFIF